MTVKECMELAGVHLGISDAVRTHFAGVATNEDKKKTSLLLTCFNIVENELAIDYFPLLAEDTIETDGGVMAYSALKNPAVRITKVTDEWGNSVEFRLFPSYLKTQPGKVRVTYTYTPVNKKDSEASDFGSTISVRLISYGMAAEYAMAMGMFEEAAVWDKKYRDSIKAAYQVQKCERIRSRRWV